VIFGCIDPVFGCIDPQGKPYCSLFGDCEGSHTNWTVSYLDPTVSEDKQFLDEMRVLSDISKLVRRVTDLGAVNLL
jgi:hypothetical protein